jgi:transposase-like protein
LKCPDCGSERVKRAGKYRGKYKTGQGYRCKDCKRFVERDGFEGKHYPKDVIVQALHLYVEACRSARSGTSSGSTSGTGQATTRCSAG